MFVTCSFDRRGGHLAACVAMFILGNGCFSELNASLRFRNRTGFRFHDSRGKYVMTGFSHSGTLQMIWERQEVTRVLITNTF